MIEFQRNKLIQVEYIEPDGLRVHGVLDDYIYSLELDVVLSLPNLVIESIDGRWNRWTTPACPLADSFLKEAVGLRVESGLGAKLKKGIGRNACRHYANLLLECCHTAKEAWWKIQQDLARESKHEGSVSVSVESEKAPEDHKPFDSAIKSGEEWASGRGVEKKDGGFHIDLHLHSLPASPCSSMSVEEMIAEAMRIGLDGICLTDHNFVWAPEDVDALRQKYGYLILAGNEILTDYGDVLVFGLSSRPNRVVHLDELREEIRRCGGYSIVAHPFRGFLIFGPEQVGLTMDKAMERYVFQAVDAIEVLNGKVTRDENDLAARVAQGLGVPGTGGSDAHDVAGIGRYVTRFEQSIGSESELIQALHEGCFRPSFFRN